MNDRSQSDKNGGQKTALTDCEAAFKKSNEAGEHPANAEAFRAFRAGWYARADTSARPSQGEKVRNLHGANIGELGLGSGQSSSEPPSLAQRKVDAQAKDGGLWFAANLAPEAYLQSALRELHAAVEADTAARSAIGDKDDG